MNEQDFSAVELPFATVDELYRNVRKAHPAFKDMTLRQFAEYANQETGSKAFNAGLSGTIGTAIKRGSAFIDELVDPYAQVAGEIGYTMASPFFSEENAQTVGRAFHGLPRGGAQMLAALPLAAAVTTGAPVALPTAVLGGLGLAGTAAQTYTETGNPWAGGVSAASLFAMPAAGRFGTGAATKLLGPAGVKAEQLFGKTATRAAERAGEYVGSNVGAGVAGEIGNEAVSALAGRGLYNPFTTENLIAQTVGQLPYAAFDLPQVLRGYKPAPVGRKGGESQVGAVPVSYGELGQPAPIASLTEWRRQGQAATLVQNALRTAAAEVRAKATTATSTTSPPAPPSKKNPPVAGAPRPAPEAKTVAEAAADVATTTKKRPTAKEVLRDMGPEAAKDVPGVTPKDKEAFVEAELESGKVFESEKANVPVEGGVAPLQPTLGDDVRIALPGGSITMGELRKESKQERVTRRQRARLSQLQRKKNLSAKESAERDELEKKVGQGTLAFDEQARRTPAILIRSTGEIVTGNWHGEAALRITERNIPEGDLEMGWVDAQGQFTPSSPKEMFTQEQLQDGFGLTGVEQTNAPKPFGISLTADKALPTAGLWDRIRAVVPKAEANVYEEFGLPQWLASQKRVTPKDLANWMMQSGPNVEVRYYRANVPKGDPDNLAVDAFSELVHIAETYHLDAREEENVMGEPTIEFYRRGEPFGEEGPDIVPHDQLPPEVQQQLERVFEARALDWYNTAEAGFVMPSIQYSTVNPKSVAKMEGLTDFVVRVPVGRLEPLTEAEWDKVEGVPQVRPKKEAKYQNLVFEHGHFNEEDQNIVGFGRGYFETLPNGDRAFVLFEVQSDWAAHMQRVRAVEEDVVAKGGAPYPKDPVLQKELLAHYQELVLKTAIRYALQNGAKHVAVVDAATGMMIEGHDRVLSRLASFGDAVFPTPGHLHEFIKESVFPEITHHGLVLHNGRVIHTTDNAAEGWPDNVSLPLYKEGDTITIVKGLVENGPSIKYKVARTEKPIDGKRQYHLELIKSAQSEGMSFNYDVQLPKLLSDLTGYKPITVDFGLSSRAFAEDRADLTFRQSLALEEGHPRPTWRKGGPLKTNVTARLFPLHKAQRVMAERLGFSFFGKDKVDAFLRDAEKTGATTEELAVALERVKDIPIVPGESVYDWLARRAGLEDLNNYIRGVQVDRPFYETYRTTFGTGLYRYFHGYFLARGQAEADAVSNAQLATRALLTATPYMRQPVPVLFRAAPGEPNFFFPLEPKTKFGGLIAIAAQQFKGRGAHEELFGQFVAISHELFHYRRMKNELVVNDLIVAADRMTPQERQEYMQFLLDRLIGPSSKGLYDFRQPAYENANTGGEEFAADLYAVFTMGFTQKGLTKDTLFDANQTTQEFIRRLTRDSAALASAVLRVSDYVPDLLDSSRKSVYEDLVTELVNTTEFLDGSQAVHESIADLLSNLNSDVTEVPELSRETAKRFARALVNVDLPFRETHLMTTEEHPDAVDAALADVEEMTKRPGDFGQRMSWYHFGYPMSQLAARFPQLKGAVDLGFKHSEVAARNIQETWGLHFLDERGKFDSPRLKRIALEGTPENKAFTLVGLLQQSEQREIIGDELRSIVRAEYPGITDAQIRAVDLSLRQIGQINVSLARKRLASYRDDVTGMMAAVLMSSNKSLKGNVAWSDAQEVVNYIFRGRMPEGPPNELASRILVAKGYSPQIAASVGQVAIGGWNAMEKLRYRLLGDDGMSGKPWYLSEVRLGDWIIAFMEENGKKRHLEAYKTKAEADKRLAELNARLNSLDVNERLVYVKAFNKSDRSDLPHALQQDTIEAYREADSLWYDHALSILRAHDPEAADEMQANFRPAMGARNVTTSPYLLPRNLIGGRELLNLAAGAVHYVDGTSYSLAKRYVKARQRTILNDPEMRANEQLRKWATTYLKAITDPEGKEFTLLKNFVFVHFMGGNISHIVIEPTQQALSHVPYLVRQGDGVMEAYGRVWRALKTVGSASVLGRMDRSGDYTASARHLKGGITDEQLNDLINEGRLARVVETGFVSDMFSIEDQEFAVTKSLLTGSGKIEAAKDVAKNAAYWMAQMARNMYSIAPRFNARLALVSAYEQARVHGSSHDDAVQVAIRATRETMFGGGRVNRPLFLHGLGKAQGVGGLAYSLQSYMMNMYAFMGRLLHDSLPSSGLDKTQRAAAMKALSTMGTTQLLLGGALGMPFVSSALAIWQQIFKEDDPKRAIREAVFKFLDDDGDFGNFWAEAALNGAANAFLPFADIGSRFQLGGMLGISPYDGITWRNLAGPVGSVAEAYARAGKGLLHGEVPEMLQALPAGLRGTAKLLADQGEVRSRQGQLLFHPTAAESALLVAGFKPRRLTAYYESQAMQQRADDARTHERNRFMSRMADLVQAGRVADVSLALTARQRETPGQFDIQEAVRRIAEIVQQRRTPRVGATVGTRAAQEDIANIRRIFPQIRGMEPSAVEELLARKETERSLGVMGTGRVQKSQLRRASLVDSLRKQNPNLTRTQAEMLAERIANPRGFAQRYGVQ